MGDQLGDLLSAASWIAQQCQRPFRECGWIDR
jgi:hypothetical protein